MNTTMIKKIDSLFADWKKPDSPGFAIGLVKEGRLVYSRGYGMASLEHNVRITPATLFDVGSTSKQFVACCSAILEKRGKLSVEDDVRKYIPELPDYGVTVRIRHLISHTSGIRDYLALMELAGMRYENEYPDAEIMELVFRQKKLNFRPGDEFLYSNSGYLLLGEIIKRVSGQTLREFAERNIFSPLGMRDTRFHDDFAEVVKNKATGYSISKDKVRLDISLFDVVGDGGINTTVEDLARWDGNFCRNTLEGGAELVKRITEPWKLNNGKRLDYAWGLFVTEYRGQKLISHGGAWVGYRADLIRFPEKDFSVICLANFSQAKPTPIAKQIADICLAGELKGPASPPVQSSAVAAVAPARINKIKTGLYLSIATGKFIEISVKLKKLFLRDEDSTYELFPVSSFGFVIASGAKEVLLERAGSKIPRISLKKLNGDTLVYERILPPALGPKVIRSLAGHYYSAELGTEYQVRALSGKLNLERRGFPCEDLKRVRGGLFAGEAVSIEFPRVGGRNANTFMLNSGRVRGVVFVRRTQRD
jgi:CubicO group peptidase (beta-lactamase class C family)